MLLKKQLKKKNKNKISPVPDTVRYLAVNKGAGFFLKKIHNKVYEKIFTIFSFSGVC